MPVSILPELKELIPPLSQAEYAQLESNILSDGCRDPLAIWNGIIIDGHNRHSICTENNIEFKTVEISFDGINSVKEWMIKNQFGRRNLPTFVRAELALKLKPVMAEKAKVQQGTRTDICQNSDKSKPIDTKKELAKEAGVSHDTIAKTEYISNNADEETKQALRRGDDDVSIHKVYTKLKSKEKVEARKEDIKTQVIDIQENKMPVLENKYHVISIDPPWPYEGGKENTFDPEARRVANPYPEMSINKIKEIQIPANDDCVMWLWTTHKFLPDAFDILEEWGFEYKATMVWNKEKIGMGHWLRMQCEFCLLAIKGNPVWENTTVRDIITSPRREHSRKPDEFFDLVNDICVGAKLEYFSREKREGWDTFGNDTDKF